MTEERPGRDLVPTPIEESVVREGVASARQASNIRQAVDFGALLAFMAAYAINRFARGLDGQEALVQATWVLVGASLGGLSSLIAIAISTGMVLALTRKRPETRQQFAYPIAPRHVPAE